MMSVGDVDVMRVEDLRGAAVLTRELLPDWIDKAADDLFWMAPDCVPPEPGRLVMRSHNSVIRTPRPAILVDTCIGNGKEAIRP